MTRLSAGLASLALATAAATAGCGGRATVPELSMGRYDEAHQTIFERAISGVQALGYVPTTIDAEHGTIVVPAAYTSRRDGGAQFHVQLYREGWVAVTMSGGAVRRDAHGAVVPAALASEYRAFALGLREHVEDRERGSLGR